MTSLGDFVFNSSIANSDHSNGFFGRRVCPLKEGVTNSAIADLSEAIPRTYTPIATTTAVLATVAKARDAVSHRFEKA